MRNCSNENVLANLNSESDYNTVSVSDLTVLNVICKTYSCKKTIYYCREQQILFQITCYSQMINAISHLSRYLIKHFRSIFYLPLKNLHGIFYRETMVRWGHICIRKVYKIVLSRFCWNAFSGSQRKRLKEFYRAHQIVIVSGMREWDTCFNFFRKPFRW